MPVSRRIALVAGDTPGHFYPALAVAEAYRRVDPAATLLFMGPPAGIAAALAEGHGCAYRPVDGSPLARTGPLGRAAAGPRTLVGVVQARRVLRASQTQLVIAFGSYAAGPAVLAARSLGLRATIHEANVFPGRANRWLGRIADRVFLNFDAAERWFPGERRRRVGWPVREELQALAGVARVAPSSSRGIRLLVLGQSRSSDSPFLNAQVPALAARLAARGLEVEVRHQAQTGLEQIDSAYRQAGVCAAVTRVIEPMSDAYRACDFVIARAGAGMIAELAIAGLPALLVPLAGAADDHQVLNGRAFAEAGGALSVPETAWDPETVAARMDPLLRDPGTWQAASLAARRLARPDAADLVVRHCEELMRGRW